MFSSWKIGADGEALQRPQIFDPVTAKTKGPQACTHCRARKLKCTGEKDGCYRCKSLSRICQYSSRIREGEKTKTVEQLQATVDVQGNAVPSETAGTGMTVQDSLNPEGPTEAVIPRLQPKELIGLVPWMATCPLLNSSPGDLSRGASFSFSDIRAMPSFSDPESDLTSQAQSNSSSGQEGNEPTLPCICLNRVLLLADEVNLLGKADIDALDVALATHRDALKHSKYMLRCPSCTRRTESLTMLTLISEKMAVLCQNIAGNMPTQSSNGREEDRSRLNEYQDIVLGNYAVESREEYGEIIRGLLRLQVSNLMLFVEELKQVAQRAGSENIMRRLAGTALSVSTLAGDL
jgi:hypothetical protein